jgi:putative transposase
MLFKNEHIKTIVEREWLKTFEKRPDVIIDEYVIMPNHLHGIVIINNPVGAYSHTPLRPIFKSPSRTLGAIIRGFKASSTLKINIYRNTPRLPVWQRNFYEHVIRNDNDLYDVRKYIQENPTTWDDDKYNP